MLCLIIAQYLHAAGFFSESPQCVFHRAVRKIAFEINKEAVLPVPLGDRAALDLGHVQIVVDKMGQNVVQGSALMGDFQTQADLVGIFAEDLLVRHNDETGGVAVGIVDPFFQNFQSVGLSCVFAGDGCLGFILFRRYF